MGTSVAHNSSTGLQSNPHRLRGSNHQHLVEGRHWHRASVHPRWDLSKIRAQALQLPKIGSAILGYSRLTEGYEELATREVLPVQTPCAFSEMPDRHRPLLGARISPGNRDTFRALNKVFVFHVRRE